MEINGLTNKEVDEKISNGLSNKASRAKTKTLNEIFIENIFSLFNFIIFGIILFVLFFYLKYNDIRLLLDSIGIFTIGVTNTFIAIFQEIKSKRALDKVNLLLKRQVCVVRQGNEELIEQTEIVLDDIIKLNRGDQAVVDGKVIHTNYIEIDESLLTGESIPVSKTVGDEILSGSFCVSGGGYFKAEKIGEQSYAYSVTNLAKKFKFILTPLQKKINLILKVMFGVALILVLLEVLFNHSNVTGLTDADFIRKIATILISLVPQGLVLFASVTFALGVYRISKIGAIIQRLNAIESFSNVQIVCMDKTGTLTENKLKVHKVTNLSDNLSDSNIEKLLGTYCKHSTEKNATIRALENFDYYETAEYIDEMPFDSAAKMSVIKMRIDNKEYYFVLGGYDILLEQVKNNLTENVVNSYEISNLSLYRNLLFGKIRSIDSIESIRKDSKTINIEPICIVSISDTVRRDVFEAIELFKNNGIKFKILSGDSTEAILAVVKEIGWEIRKDEVISGNELDSLNDVEFASAINNKTIFGRLKPEHKLRIIKSLRKQKTYTAMIGDGVNDLPAIKESDMGIAMEEGSAITKEVADIVLLKNKFSLLPQIFNEGNKIVNTVNSVAKLFLTKNFMVIYLSLVSLIFLFDFPLTPRRVALLNIFAIGLPALVLALKNQNVSKCKNFLKDIFSFISISAAIIISGGYLGYYLTQKLFHPTGLDLEMIMVTIMIFISIANFITVAISAVERTKFYFIYGLMLISLYMFFAFIKIDFSVFKLIKLFYEINYVSTEYWLIIFIVSIVGSLSLFFLQKLRENIFMRS